MEQPNCSYIDEISGDDLEFRNTLIGIMKAEWPQEVDEYRGNFNDSAFAKAALNVHKIKHKLGMVGLVKDYALAVQFENDLKKGKTEKTEEFEAVLNKVSDFISQL